MTEESDSRILWRKFVFLLGSVLFVAGVSLFVLETGRDADALDAELLSRARAQFQDNLETRGWYAAHRGFYIEKRPGVESNPFLDDPDIHASNGKTYTLRMPGQLSRETSSQDSAYGYRRVHATSLNPINPASAPDEWERTALLGFEAGRKEFFGKVDTGGLSLFRYMAPLYAKSACLDCHKKHNYKLDDVIGGISVSLDLNEVLATAQRNKLVTGVELLLAFSCVFLVACRFLSRVVRRLSQVGTRHAAMLRSVDGILWEGGSQILSFSYVSGQAERLLGYPLSDWYQPGFWRAHLHPEDSAALPACDIASTSLRDPRNGEFRMMARDGRVVWLYSQCTVVEAHGGSHVVFGLMVDITERKRQEEIARVALRERDTVLHNAMVAIVYLRHRRIVSCNRRFEEMFGYAHDELIGVSTEQLYDCHQTYLDAGEHAYDELGEGRSNSQELMLKHKDGSVFRGALTGCAIDQAHAQEGSIWIYADISERHRAEQEVHKLLQAVEQSPVSIVITSREGLIEYVNPRFTKVTGYTRQEAIGQNPRILQSGETPLEVYQDLWKTLLGGKEWRGIVRNRRKSGELFWEEASISPILSEHGEITHFVAVKEDITERKRIEGELENQHAELENQVQQRTAELSTALEAAKLADRAKDQFLANISHELRTPLNAVIGLADMARRISTEPRQQGYLDKVSNAGKTLSLLINDLLDLTKIAAGRMEFENITFSLRKLISNSCSVVRHKADEKGLLLIEKVDEAVPDILLGDPLRIEQILLNLSGNAIKFTQAGRVEIRVGVHASEPSRICLCIDIEDTGVGLSESAIALLFKPFVQADASMTRKFGGTGLGLSICKLLAEKMGGNITITSREGRGSIFHVMLWLALGRIEDLPEIEAPGEDASLLRYRDARVLVVEDQPLNREIVEALLALVGIVPSEACNGQEALDLLDETGADAFDLVLMDIQMPVMDGLTATRELRSRKGFEAIPIIAMTAHTMEHEKEISRQAGMSDHIGKPFDNASFYRTLAKWIPLEKQYEQDPEATAAKPADPVTDRRLLALEHVDVQAGAMRFGGKIERYIKWLGVFVDEGPATVVEIRQLLAGSTPEVAGPVAHALKGRVGMLGMVELHPVVSALEHALRTGDPAGELLARTEELVGQMSAGIRAALEVDLP